MSSGVIGVRRKPVRLPRIVTAEQEWTKWQEKRHLRREQQTACRKLADHFDADADDDDDDEGY